MANAENSRVSSSQVQDSLLDEIEAQIHRNYADDTFDAEEEEQKYLSTAKKTEGRTGGPFKPTGYELIEQSKLHFSY